MRSIVLIFILVVFGFIVLWYGACGTAAYLGGTAAYENVQKLSEDDVQEGVDKIVQTPLDAARAHLSATPYEKVTCQDHDQDNDGYVRCTVTLPEGETRILLCAEQWSLNRGCKQPEVLR